MGNNGTARTIETTGLVELLRWRAIHQPDRLAYTFLHQGEMEEARLTYAELDRQARAIATLLQAKGAAGKPVLLLHPPGIHYVAAVFGCLYAGAIAVPAYPPYSTRMVPRIHAILADTRSHFILTTSETLAALQGRLALIPDLQYLEWIATDTIGAHIAEEWQEPRIGAETTAFLQYTSGSTALPKGVMVSHGNLWHNLEMLVRHCEQTPESHMVSWLPPYHDLGLVCGIMYPFYVGYPATLMSPVAFLQRPFRWLRAISTARATMSIAPNFAYDLCCRKVTPEQRAMLDLSSWEVAANGGEPARDETMTRFCETFAACGFRRETFFPGYGMAETTLIIATSQINVPPVIGIFDKGALERNEAISVSQESENACKITGYELFSPDQKVIVVDPETRIPCPPHCVGEIWISGPSVTQGYWRKPEETGDTFHACLADSGEGPYLRTGDLGFMQRGELFVTGRLKDLIIIHGRNHYPHDIELTVDRSHPALRLGCCAAFSVDVDNKEQLVILVEIEPRYQPLKQQAQEQAIIADGPRKPLDPQTVINAIRQAIAQEHDIQTYRVVLLKAGGVLKTSSGKLQRRACRAAFLSGNLNVWDE
ncbi:MAG TPA: fatty acyl-AMP ligase [Ktedonobacteraceae bacterium]|nr:fatty acyl-AMP ligase [Ktedonobacteraceae bacterium]